MYRFMFKLHHCVDINIENSLLRPWPFIFTIRKSSVGQCGKKCTTTFGNSLEPFYQNHDVCTLWQVNLEPVYRDSKILGFPEMHFFKSKLMHKYHNGKLPIMFNECFPNNETIPHHYNIGRINPPRQILSGYSEKNDQI